MKKLVSLIPVFAVAALCADPCDPQVSNVRVAQDAARIVTVTYDLDEPAVVTMDVLTNGVSIGGANIQCVSGACFKKVTAGSGHVLTWDPTVSWPDQKLGTGILSVRLTAWALDKTPDYMAVDISSGARANSEMYYPSAAFVPGGVTNALYKTTKLLLRRIPAKGVEWTMGSTKCETQREFYGWGASEAGREATHQVILPNDYYIGVYEVTQAQWGEIATNALINVTSFFTVEGALRPVDSVTHDALRTSQTTWRPCVEPGDGSYLDLLRIKTGIAFDLPSEAQWEFAARGGHGAGYWNDGSPILNTDLDENLNRLGRYIGTCVDTNAEDRTLPPERGGTAIVGSYESNSYGLHDMHGNVLEWCLDWYEVKIATLTDTTGAPYAGRANIHPTDLMKTLSGGTAVQRNSKPSRIQRGGCWSDNASLCRCAGRGASAPNNSYRAYGFRVVVACP